MSLRQLSHATKNQLKTLKAPVLYGKRIPGQAIFYTLWLWAVPAEGLVHHQHQLPLCGQEGGGQDGRHQQQDQQPHG